MKPKREKNLFLEKETLSTLTLNGITGGGTVSQASEYGCEFTCSEDTCKRTACLPVPQPQ
jgi:hypothetical protein